MGDAVMGGTDTPAASRSTVPTGGSKVVFNECALNFGGPCIWPECKCRRVEPDDDGEGLEVTEDYDPGEECGRWRNGRLAPWRECLSAGTEFCQFDCQHGR